MNLINVLYITRKFPPMIGGMETMSAALANEFMKHVPTTLIAWRKSQKYLPYFIPFAFIKACIVIPKKKITNIHIGDALLAPFGLFLKKLFGIKASINIAGLDIVFNFPGYQWIIPKCVAQFDLIICISNATRDECLKRGIPKKKCIVIPCGVYPEEWIINATKEDLGRILQQDITNKNIIITVGRLVRRKGVLWFIQHVMPQLGQNFLYLVIGEGPDQKQIQQIIHQLHLENNVMLLGKIPNDTLKIIYNTADVFVMPNVPTPGTMEGFGIVAVEASITGLPVIAADCEGIRDAIIPGKTGVRIIPKDHLTFIQLLKELPITNKKTVMDTTKQAYSWEAIGNQYIASFKQI